MIAFWTMWLKRHHPKEFYIAAMHKYGHKKNSYGMNKGEEILRDTKKFGRDIEIAPPCVQRSGPTWSAGEGEVIRAGFSQIQGIGEAMSERIIEARAESPNGFNTWNDLKSVRGVGDKTIQKIMEFAESDDPFELNLLGDTLRSLTKEILGGKLGPVPRPTHKSVDVPYEKGADMEVTWLGLIRHRNLKDLFELHYSRTGEELDREEVRDPHLNEWVTMVGEDDTDLLDITVDRWRYPKWKRMIWGMELGKHFVLIRGVKRGFQARRAISVTKMFVIDPESE
jgi:ribosomal protein S13